VYNFNYDITAETANELYSVINAQWAVNAHYGKCGNNVRLFGDTPKDRAEIWKNGAFYDVFVGMETSLYNHANALLESGWNEKYKGAKSKNEIALYKMTASDVTLLLKPLEIVKEEPKTETAETKPPKRKRQSKKAEKAVKVG